MEELNNKNCSINDCSNNWKMKQKIIISEKNKCVYNCTEDDTYFYTYKNKCYNSCPNGTKLLDEITYLCIIECSENLPFEKNGECLSSCTGEDFFNNICKINNKTIEAKENMVNLIENEIINENMNSLLNIINEENKDLIIKDNNEIYQITSSYNQKNNEIIMVR